jgi:hypothetical protein
MHFSWQALFFVSILISSGSVTPLVFAQNDVSYVSPLKQFKNVTISVYDVKCKVGFDLVIKTSDDSPACVKPSTAQKLVEHGWGILKEQTVWFGYIPIACQQSPWEQFWNKSHPNAEWGRIAITSTIELQTIKEYFNASGITILDVKAIVLPSNLGMPPPQCGSPSGAVYFLVSVSDEIKMNIIGYNMLKTDPPSNPYLISIR